MDIYFEWIYSLVRPQERSYRELLRHLYERPFIFTMPMDGNRGDDGLDLRYRFERETGEWCDRQPDQPCSVLEMMVALSIRCEEHIMDDPGSGDRTGQWFWGMIDNLGLTPMQDGRFDTELVSEAMDRLTNRTYGSNGEGGLFAVKRAGYDLRTVDIWYQAMWYLDSIM